LKKITPMQTENDCWWMLWFLCKSIAILVPRKNYDFSDKNKCSKLINFSLETEEIKYQDFETAIDILNSRNV
jgi:hypothetical protein